MTEQELIHELRRVIIRADRRREWIMWAAEIGFAAAMVGLVLAAVVWGMDWTTVIK